MVAAASVSPGAFQLLGATPLVGRTFTDEEDHRSARVVVLSFGLWRTRYGSDPAVIGRSIEIDREPYQIIGVMRSDFEPAFIRSEMWLPLGIYEGNVPLPNATFIQTIGRVRAGVREGEASAELNEIMRQLAGEYPKSLGGWTAFAMNLRRAQFNDQRQAVQVLLIAGFVLAVIACANIANLTLSEVMRRRSEATLRTILGATRADLLVTTLVESVLIAILGTGFGLVISRAALLVLLPPGQADSFVPHGIQFDGRVTMFTLLLAFATSLAAHLWPVIRFSGKNLPVDLAEASHRTIGSKRGGRARHLLLATQTALSLVLLVSGGLLLSAFLRLATNSPGYDPGNVLMLRLRFVESAYPTVSARATFMQSMLDRIEQVPGVVAAGTVNSPLTVGNHYVTLVQIEGKPAPDGQPYTVEFRRVSPGYFKALRIRQQRGRSFSPTDGSDAPSVAVINRAFAERFWPGEDAVSKRIQRNGANSLTTVVGIVDDVRDYDLNVAPQPTMYLPFAQNNAAVAPAAIAVRTTGDPLRSAAAVRAAIYAVDPREPVDRVVPLVDFLAETIGPQGFRSTLVLAFAILGLTLTSIGTYGITTRSVQERTDEFGIRVALGATRHEIWRIAMSQSLKPVGIGLMLGVGLSVVAVVLLSRVLTGMFVTALIVWVPILTVIIVALVAAGWPAYAATNLNPLQAIHSRN